MWYVRAGSKVTGPFTEEQLVTMRKRGQFSPIHQVSADRIRWESASSLVKLLDAKVASPQNFGRSQSSSGPMQGARTLTDVEPPGAEGKWYYLDASQSQVGPFSLSVMMTLIQNGGISRGTMVCASGESQWTSVEQHPVLSGALPGSWRWFVIACTSAFLLIGGIGGTFVLGPLLKTQANSDKDSSDKDSDKNSSDNSDKKESRDSLLVTSLKDEEIVKQAVGLVVLTMRVKWPDGRIEEEPKKTGSCFAISPDGYLLTNRHVVNGYNLTPQQVTVDIKGTPTTAVVDKPVMVFFNRIRFEAKVLHVDQKFDLAILKIDRARPQPYLAISKLNKFQRGEKCFALGFPGVASQARSDEEAALQGAKLKNDRIENILLDQNFEYSYQGGEISRVIPDSTHQYNIEHSAKIFRGNSGGPLIDSKCTVIGINTQITSDLADTLYIAFATGQFRNVVDEFTGGVATRRD